MKIFKITGLLFLLTILIFVVWMKLPPSINRYNDIKFGEELIEKIENYRKLNGQLPETGDWQAMRKLGFKDKGDFFVPEYQKLNDDNYALVYVEGFDGPYLLWNSSEKIWQVDMPTYPDDCSKK